MLSLSAAACRLYNRIEERVISAILRRNHCQAPVYRAAQSHIGCSLAESAETSSYKAWLAQAASPNQPSLHFVYINTSLETKAHSAVILPTITCTSSNVLQILQASAQLGHDLRISSEAVMGVEENSSSSSSTTGAWSCNINNNSIKYIQS